MADQEHVWKNKLHKEKRKPTQQLKKRKTIHPLKEIDTPFIHATNANHKHSNEL